MSHALRLYAHRGAAIELPENTMPAFARAAELGVDALEMDGHLTRDGHVVISHDPSGERMCGVDAPIKESVLSEVTSWNAATRFRRTDGSSFETSAAIPTLDAVLGEFPNLIVNFDLKQERPSMVAPTLAVIEKHGAADRVILASFSSRTLLEVRRAGYPGVTALPRAELLAFMAMPRWAFARLPLRGGAAQLPTRVGPLNVGSTYVIDKCHAVGIRADFWTVNEPSHAQALLEAGADGIMTDDPAAMMPVFERWRSR